MFVINVYENWIDLRFSVISSTCLRLHALIRFEGTKDNAYYLATVSLWAMLELAGTLVVACLPTVPRFLKLLRQRPPVARPSLRLFNITHSITRSRQERSYSFSRRWKLDGHKSRPLISDVEYHELVNRTENSIATDIGHIAPWINIPPEAHAKSLKTRNSI